MRKSLAPRRASYTIAFEHVNGVSVIQYIVTYSCFREGSVAELFVNTDGKVGSAADVMVSDGATAISLALQYGCPVEVMQRALKRDADGGPMGALAHALDLVVEECGDKNNNENKGLDGD
jgi:hypothetical protein